MSNHLPLVFALSLLALVGVVAALRWRQSASPRAEAVAWARTAAEDLIRLPGRLRRVAADPRTPRRVRWLLVLLAVYVASPIDLIPDFIPILGQADDLVVIAIALAAIHRMIPDEVWTEYFPERATGPP